MKYSWTTEKQVRTVWLKFYAEQCAGYKEGMTPAEEAELLRQTLLRLNRITGMIEISYHGIVHDKDTNSDDFWKPSAEKPHAHLLLMLPDNTKLRFSSLLGILKSIGIAFREETDDTMLYKSTSFPDRRKDEHIRAVVYHTHETYRAQDEEGKAEYDRSECYTNIPLDILEGYYEKYFRSYDVPTRGDIKNLKNIQVNEYIRQAYETGRTGEPFNNWYDKLDVNTKRSLRSNDKILRSEYDRGISEYLNSPESTKNIRCCIFISGAPNTGKTYTSKTALKEMDLKVYSVDGGGTGKFDNLSSTHNAIVASDCYVKDLKTMADNTWCRAYRRCSDNPLWCGKYLIITYNASLESYLKDFAPFMKNHEIEAIRSRFFETEIKDNTLKIISCSVRGTAEDIKTRLDMFKEFKKRFDRLLKDYKPDSLTEDDCLEYLGICTHADRNVYYGCTADETISVPVEALVFEYSLCPENFVYRADNDYYEWKIDGRKFLTRQMLDYYRAGNTKMIRFLQSYGLSKEEIRELAARHTFDVNDLHTHFPA